MLGINPKAGGSSPPRVDIFSVYTFDTFTRPSHSWDDNLLLLPVHS